MVKTIEYAVERWTDDGEKCRNGWMRKWIGVANVYHGEDTFLPDLFKCHPLGSQVSFGGLHALLCMRLAAPSLMKEWGKVSGCMVIFAVSRSKGLSVLDTGKPLTRRNYHSMHLFMRVCSAAALISITINSLAPAADVNFCQPPHLFPEILNSIHTFLECPSGVQNFPLLVSPVKINRTIIFHHRHKPFQENQ